MKSLVSAAIAAVVLAVPAISFAQQTNAPVTRAQVREQLVELERAGYNPNDWIHYPENIQAAEARVAAEHAARDNAVANAQPVSVKTSAGSSSSGASRSGDRSVGDRASNGPGSVFLGQ
jgi:Domain of unknown function (DUF4148)